MRPDVDRRAGVQAEVRCCSHLRAGRASTINQSALTGRATLTPGRWSAGRAWSGITPMPSRAALRAKTRAEARLIEPWLTNDDFRRFKWWREAERDFQPFHQRTFFAAHPDLSYTSLNGDEPLKTSPHHEDGVLERMKLIRDKLPGVEDIIRRVPPVGAASVARHAGLCAGLDGTARSWPGDEPLADGPQLGRGRHAHGARPVAVSTLQVQSGSHANWLFTCETGDPTPVSASGETDPLSTLEV